MGFPARGRMRSMETVALAPDVQPGPLDDEAPATLAPLPFVPDVPRPKLASGWAAFDELDLVRPGRVVLLDVGAEAGQRLVCRLLADAVAKAGEAVVLDGGNWLDVYRLGDEAEAAGHPRAATLHGVRVARGFTAYQLQALVEDALPPLMRDAGDAVGLVVASMFPEMYLDEDLKPDEARVLAKRALGVLRDVAREHDVPVLVTNSTLAPGLRHRMRAALDQDADDVVGLFPAPQGALRIHAPALGMSVLAPAPGARQRRLDDYAGRLDARGEDGAFQRHAIDARIRYLPRRVGEMEHMRRQKERVIAVV